MTVHLVIEDRTDIPASSEVHGVYADEQDAHALMDTLRTRAIADGRVVRFVNSSDEREPFDVEFYVETHPVIAK